MRLLPIAVALRSLWDREEGDTLGQLVTSVGLVALACALAFLAATYVSPEWRDMVKPVIR